MPASTSASESRIAITDYVALVAIAVGALAAVLVVTPYRSFDLDRFLAPKEVALHITATIAALCTLRRITTLRISLPDAALIVWIALSALSAVFATNHWVALRAFGVTASSAVLYWSARRISDAGLARALVASLAFAVVIGALTALAQAYGIRFDFATLSRAPGGTFGNRNFMAHLAAAGIPLLLYCGASARTERGATLGTAGVLICSAALMLSRTRAAWLALMLWGALAVVVLFFGPTVFDSKTQRKRASMMVAAAVVGGVLALILPNALDWKSDNPYLDSVKGVVNYREGSGAGRLKQYTNSARMALHHPLLGVGAGNWPVVYPSFAPADDPSLSGETGMTSNPWPSSDWVAALSERGLLAVVALIVFACTLAYNAARLRYDPYVTPEARLAVFAGISVLGVAMIEGGLDAVLLLPANAVVVWSIAGALLPHGKAVRIYELAMPYRIALFIVSVAVPAHAAWSSNNRVNAMQLYSLGRISSIEQASDLDPGAYRIRMRAAELYLLKGQCANARKHAVVAHDLFPFAPAPKRMLAQCPAAAKRRA